MTSVNQVPEIFQKTETSGIKRLAEADKVCQEMFIKKLIIWLKQFLAGSIIDCWYACKQNWNEKQKAAWN